MKNFEEIMSERKNRIEARKDELIRRSLLSEEFLEMIQKNKRPFDPVSYTHLTLPTTPYV